jgi:transcriptional regulator with XRE-family HTH domain
LDVDTGPVAYLSTWEVAQAPRKLSPTESAQHLLGAELRDRRELRGLSQDELGARVFVSGDTLSKAEGAKRFPSREVVARCDDVLGTTGGLARLWDLANAQRLDGRTRSAKQANHVDTSPLDLQGALSAGRMKLRIEGDGMWHVDVTGRSSIVREVTNAAGDVASDSITEAPTAAERPRALAHYLDLPWTWLIHRCGAACSYVGVLPADS